MQLVIWDFNDGDTTADSGVNASGSSLALVGGTTATFATGSPLDTAATNRSYNTTNYPAQGTNNLTAGIVFNTPTTGYINITVQFDVRWSNTASKYLRFQYTYDGTNWIDGPQLVAPGGDTWWSSQNITNPNGNTRYFVNFFGDTQADNNANFAFRILAEFAPGDNNYHGARDGNAAGYRTNCTLRYDLGVPPAMPTAQDKTYPFRLHTWGTEPLRGSPRETGGTLRRGRLMKPPRDWHYSKQDSARASRIS